MEQPTAPDTPVDIAEESVAGEEDPGAALVIPKERDYLCRTCGGDGQLNGGACPDCDGTGKLIPGR